MRPQVDAERPNIVMLQPQSNCATHNCAHDMIVENLLTDL
jgi:hypothetical protein